MSIFFSIFLMIAFKCVVSSACSEEITSASGIIKSPNFPQPYSSGLECVWNIKAPDGYRIILNFTSFEVEEDFFDMVLVESISTKGEIHEYGKYTGSTLPPPIFSKHNHLRITFTSDDQNEENGFRAFFNTDTCNHEITDANGMIKSPNFPNFYTPELKCVWNIKAPVHFQITLTFRNFSLEPDFNDQVVVDSISDDGLTYTYGSNTGTFLPSQIKSKYNNLRITFTSNDQIQGTGFRAFFLSSSCSREIRDASGIITSPNYPNNYPSNTKCVWDIIAPPHFKISLKFSRFHLQGDFYDRLTFEDITEEGVSHVLYDLTGTYVTNPVVVSSGRRMRLTFTSDAATANVGFRAIFHRIDQRKIPTCFQIKTSFTGYVSDTAEYWYHHKCWKINVPRNSYIKIQIQNFNLAGLTCNEGYLKVSITKSDESYVFCNETGNRTITSLTDVEIYFEVDLSPTKHGYRGKSFSVVYEINDMECTRNDIFHCSPHECVPNAALCNGVKDCDNGADEKGCEQNIAAIKGMSSSLMKGSDTWGWMESSPRSVIALYLGGRATFDGGNRDEKMMMKETETTTALALMRNSISSEQLSMLIHALLITCHDPRHFYGQDLVGRLLEQVTSSESSIHPIAYLAICNSKTSWPSKAYVDIENILNKDSNSPFVKDIQAFALLALSCDKNRTEEENYRNFTILYQNTIEKFKKLRSSDGSFGNIQTTSLITQALLSSDEESNLNLNSTFDYLLKRLEGSQFDVVSSYLVLPVLNRKNLADIAKVNCSSKPRKQSKAFKSNSKEYTGPKIHVQYVLYIGNEKEVIHTISLRVPKNITAFEVMRKAEFEDPKYTFQWKKSADEVNVYGIGKYTNDPELGMYWFLYVQSNHDADNAQHSTLSPNKLVLKDDDILIMWYKAADF